MGSPPGKPSTVLFLPRVFEQLRDIEPAGVEDAAVDVGDADDFVTGLVHQARGLRADVAKALHDHARCGALAPEALQRLVADNHAAAPGGLPPAARAAQVERLAGHARRHGVAHVHGVGVHDPRHGLLVGVHVGRGDIALRADVVQDFRRVAPRDALQFALGELLRVADDAALGAAEGNVDHRAFPGHLGREAADFVQRHVRDRSGCRPCRARARCCAARESRRRPPACRCPSARECAR